MCPGDLAPLVTWLISVHGWETIIILHIVALGCESTHRPSNELFMPLYYLLYVGSSGKNSSRGA